MVDKALNVSKETTVAVSIKNCRTWWDMTRGLMFRDVVPLMFCFNKPRIVKLHSWFVREPLDLIFIKDNIVVELKSEWSTWSSYVSNKEASLLLELPKGSIKSSGTEVGDMIMFLLVAK